MLFVMFDKEHKWMTGQMKKHIREVNEMFLLFSVLFAV